MDNTTTVRDSTETVTGNWFTTADSVIISVILALILTSNSTVLYIYTQSRQLVRTHIFELFVAVIDLFAGVVLLPIVHLTAPHLAGATEPNIAVLLAIFVTMFTSNSYVILLQLAAIDKFVAVYWPFKYRTKTARTQQAAIVMTVVPALTGAIAGAYCNYNPTQSQYRHIFNTTRTVSISLSLCLLVVIYGMVIFKIRQMSRKLHSGVVTWAADRSLRQTAIHLPDIIRSY